MNTFGDFKAGVSGSTLAKKLGFALAFAATVACESSDDTGNPGPSSGGASSGGTSAAPVGGTSGGSMFGAGQGGNAGQGTTGGKSASGGQTGTGGQTSAGGQGAKGGQSAGGSQSAGGGGTGGGSTGGSKSGGGTGGGSAGGMGSGGAGSCPHVELKGNDICTIGDSWIQIPGNQVTTLQNHMKAAGVIPQGDNFDRRERSGSALSAIIGTYDSMPSNCKILVMDGGGIDLISTPAGDQGAITPVVNKFKDFLAKLKTDGYVQHVIYSLYPVIPGAPTLNANMKPGFSAACEASEVDCHLVDLEPLFMGQHFPPSDQLHSDMAGGVIIGDAWWKAMQQNCIAQ